MKLTTAAALLLINCTQPIKCFQSQYSRNSSVSKSHRTQISTPPRHLSASIDYFSSSKDDESSRSDSSSKSNNIGSYENYSNQFNSDLEEFKNDEGDGKLEKYAKLLQELNLEIPVSARNIVPDSTRKSVMFDLTMPITKVKGERVGLSLREVKNAKVSDVVLDLDSMKYVQQNVEENSLDKKLDPSFSGIIVASVLPGSRAQDLGLQEGDVIVASSATIGDKVWPKSTLEGLRSAMSSRRLMSQSMTLRIRRSTSYIAATEVIETFELALARPIGIRVEDEEDGYVKVVEIDNKAKDQVLSMLRVGDRVVAIDSSLGSNMWPVSNVEGVVSAATTRLPGQPVRMRFERVINVGQYKEEEIEVDDENSPVGPSLNGAIDGFRSLQEEASTTRTIQTVGSNTHKLLLTRCRDVVQKYVLDYDGRRSLPVAAADKVLEALADANAPFDARTLGVVLNAYNKCRRPLKVIRAFEAATGLSADGSNSKVSTIVRGKKNEDAILPPDLKALDIVTATALLRAHALKGDYYSARRVLAAMEGEEWLVDGIPASTWPMKNCSVDTHCYNIVIDAAAKFGGKEGLNSAVYLFDRMAEPGAANKDSSMVVKDLYTYNTMIAAFARAGRVDDAYTIYYSMKQAGVDPDQVTFTALMKAVAEMGRIDEALQLLSAMKAAKDVKVDAVAYNTIIKSYCDRKKLFEAKNLVAEMDSLSVKPNSMTYSLLMKGLLKVDKPAACLTLFETACADPDTSSSTENKYLYTTAVTAAAKVGDYERALELVTRMKSFGLRPNMRTLTSLLTACVRSKQTETAVEVFSQIRNLKYVDGLAIKLGLRALCDNGNYDEASDILMDQLSLQKELKGKDIMESFNYLLRSALSAGNFSAARNALEQLIAAGNIPSRTTYRFIRQGLGMTKQNYGKVGQKLKFDRDNQKSPEKFDFLLYVLDLVHGRKLEIDGFFYAAILLEGVVVGGSRRRIASLLVKARENTDSSGIKINSGRYSEEKISSEPVFTNWSSILLDNSSIMSAESGKLGLPLLKVKVRQEESRRVVFAETSAKVSIRKKSHAAKRRKPTVAVI